VVDVVVDGCDEAEVAGAPDREEEAEAEAPVEDGAGAGGDVEATWTVWSFPR
jgi:hypothetical protein